MLDDALPRIAPEPSGATELQPAGSTDPEQTAAGENLPILEAESSHDTRDLATIFQAVVEQSGLTAATIVRRFAGLAMGPGRLSFRDFVHLRLFDDRFHAAARPETFVGQRRNRQLVLTINFRHDWFGLMSDKIASSSYLSAYGLPTAPVRALYAPSALRNHGGTHEILQDRSALTTFLADPASYPLFGKPVESCQSLGSIALTGCSADGRWAERADGRVVSLASLVDEIDARYSTGYMIQPWLRPDPAIEELCGRRLATVRLMTASGPDGPRILRAAWKVPAGANDADNYWRSGNLLVEIDLDKGVTGRALCGAGLEAREMSRHPDTGADLRGVSHPQWAAMRQLALEGARAMRHVPLIGWDIACTDQGPLIVEMNEMPDFFLPQFADSRGMIDDLAEVSAFSQKQKLRADRDAKAAIRAL